MHVLHTCNLHWNVRFVGLCSWAEPVKYIINGVTWLCLACVCVCVCVNARLPRVGYITSRDVTWQCNMKHNGEKEHASFIQMWTKRSIKSFGLDTAFQVFVPYNEAKWSYLKSLMSLWENFSLKNGCHYMVINSNIRELFNIFLFVFERKKMKSSEIPKK